MFNIEKLKNFVKVHTRGRDSSHGYQHMKKVYENAMTICSKLDGEIDVNIIKWVTIVAWLHDVADHKYDKTGETKRYVQYFLHECDPTHSADLMTCIDCISFSKEKNIIRRFFHPNLFWSGILSATQTN